MSHFDSLIGHQSVFSHLAAGSPPVPVHVRIEPTECCNMRCIFCVWHDTEIHKDIASVTSYTGKASLSCERLIRLTEELKGLGTKAVSFTGAGDPLVYPHIEEVLRKVASNGIQFAITSNFSMPLSDSLLAVLCNAGWVRISMNAAEPDTYARIHAPVETDRELVFNRLKDNIRRLVAARRALGADMRINASFVVSEHNSNEVLKAGRQAEKLGFDSISFRPDDPSIQGSKPIPFSCSVKKQLAALESLQSEKFRISAQDSYGCRVHEETRGVTCRYAEHTAYIAATGEVYPCCYTRYNKRFIIGNILTMDFRDFWWSRQHQENLGQILIENCPECPYDETNIRLNSFSPEVKRTRSDTEDFI